MLSEIAVMVAVCASRELPPKVRLSHSPRAAVICLVMSRPYVSVRWLLWMATMPCRMRKSR